MHVAGTLNNQQTAALEADALPLEYEFVGHCHDPTWISRIGSPGLPLLRREPYHQAVEAGGGRKSVGLLPLVSYSGRVGVSVCLVGWFALL